MSFYEWALAQMQLPTRIFSLATEKHVGLNTFELLAQK